MGIKWETYSQKFQIGFLYYYWNLPVNLKLFQNKGENANTTKKYTPMSQYYKNLIHP